MGLLFYLLMGLYLSCWWASISLADGPLIQFLMGLYFTWWWASYSAGIPLGDGLLLQLLMGLNIFWHEVCFHSPLYCTYSMQDKYPAITGPQHTYIQQTAISSCKKTVSISKEHRNIRCFFFFSPSFSVVFLGISLLSLFLCPTFLSQCFFLSMSLFLVALLYLFSLFLF